MFICSHTVPRLVCHRTLFIAFIVKTSVLVSLSLHSVPVLYASQGPARGAEGLKKLRWHQRSKGSPQASTANRTYSKSVAEMLSGALSMRPTYGSC